MTDKNPITQSIDWLVECGWNKEQATNLAGAIKADSPEQLWEVAPLWLEHCGESMKYVNDMLGSVAMGLIEVTQGGDGEWLFKLNDAGMGVGKQLNEKQDMTDEQEMAATPHAELIADLMNPNNPKNEREHAAVREIERLREVQQAVIAGALFDFMGWLTSRKERIILSSADEVSPAVDAIRDFAKMRSLSLDDAQVQDWQSAPQRKWIGLTDDEIVLISANCAATHQHTDIHFARAIEAKLKQKNS